jgi:hypothetical protein
MEVNKMVFCRNCGKDLKPRDFVIIWDGDKRVVGAIKQIVEEEVSDEEEFEIEYIETITLSNGEKFEMPDLVFCSDNCEEEFMKTMKELFSEDS